MLSTPKSGDRAPGAPSPSPTPPPPPPAARDVAGDTAKGKRPSGACPPPPPPLSGAETPHALLGAMARSAAGAGGGEHATAGRRAPRGDASTMFASMDAAVLGSIEEIDMDVDDLAVSDGAGDVGEHGELAVLGEVEEMGTDLSSVWLDIAGAKLGTADGNDPNQDNETLPVDFHQFASEFLLQEDDDGAMDTILLGS